MAEQNQEPAVAPINGGTPPVNETPTIEQLQSKLEETMIKLENVTKAQSGSDAAVTAKTKEIEELRNALKEKMSESERRELETKEKIDRLSILEKDLENEKAERKRDKLHAFKLEQMAVLDVDLKYQKFIHGDTEDDIVSEIKDFKKNRDEDLKSVKSKLMDHGEPVKGDIDPSGMTREKWDSLDMIEQNKLYVGNPEKYKIYTKKR